MNQLDFYQRLRRRGPLLTPVFLVPDLLHLVFKLAGDSRVPTRKKTHLIIFIVYLISPIDLLPELVLGLGGYLDDAALAALILHTLVNGLPAALVQEHWAGSPRGLQFAQGVVRRIDKVIGGGLWRRLRGLG